MFGSKLLHISTLLLVLPLNNVLASESPRIYDFVDKGWFTFVWASLILTTIKLFECDCVGKERRFAQLNVPWVVMNEGLTGIAIFRTQLVDRSDDCLFAHSLTQCLWTPAHLANRYVKSKRIEFKDEHPTKKLIQKAPQIFTTFSFHTIMQFVV